GNDHQPARRDSAVPEHVAGGRLVYLETDPVTCEIRLHHKNSNALAMMEPHRAFFTWGLNYGHPDCQVPLPERFRFRPSPPPVLPHRFQAIWTIIGGISPGRAANSRWPRTRTCASAAAGSASAAPNTWPPAGQ